MDIYLSVGHSLRDEHDADSKAGDEVTRQPPEICNEPAREYLTTYSLSGHTVSGNPPKDWK